MPSIVPPTSDTQDDDGPDALDSLPLAALLHSRLASWFGDDRQSFLVADLVPVVTQIVAEYQYAAVEMARKADIAESRAEEAEYHAEQLRDARDSAERLLDGWVQDGPDDPAIHLLIRRVREALDVGKHSGNECDHDWLDRPESDTRECLICGTEVSG